MNRSFDRTTTIFTYWLHDNSTDYEDGGSKTVTYARDLEHLFFSVVSKNVAKQGDKTKYKINSVFVLGRLCKLFNNKPHGANKELSNSRTAPTIRFGAAQKKNMLTETKNQALSERLLSVKAELSLG